MIGIIVVYVLIKGLNIDTGYRLLDTLRRTGHLERAARLRLAVFV